MLFLIIVKKALNGEDVVISKAGKPLVRLVSYEELPESVTTGLLEGQILIAAVMPKHSEISLTITKTHSIECS